MGFSAMIASKFAEVAISKLLDRLLARICQDNNTGEIDILTQLSDPVIARRFADKYIARHVTMRTIVAPNQDVLLNDIYVPIRLRVHSSPKTYVDYHVDENFAFSFKSVVNIVGVAGQGKTTVLRKLFVDSFEKGKKFPFFIELRRLGQSKIIEHLHEHLENVGILVRDGNIDSFLASGRVVIYLDGFDELKTEFRQVIVDQISSLSLKYGISIVVTSRPNTEICRTPFVENFELLPLRYDEVRIMLKKLSDYDEVTESHSLANTLFRVTAVLTTPILVNLYYICSVHENKVLGNVSDFYEHLFLTLFKRHDSHKGYDRERSSSFEVETVARVFESLCYYSLNNEQLDFTHQQLLSLVQNGLQANELGEQESEAVLSDIINFTSLIQKDGFDHYVFIHKSIPEFYCAKYIAKLDITQKQKEYSRLRASIEVDRRYDAVISYLSSTDLSSFYDEFIIKYFNGYGFNAQNLLVTLTSLAEKIVSLVTVAAYIDNHRHITVSLSRNLSDEGLLRTIRLLKSQSNTTFNLSMTLDRFRDYPVPHQRLAQISIADKEYIDTSSPYIWVELDREYNVRLDLYLKESGIYSQVLEEISACLYDAYQNIYLA